MSVISSLWSWWSHLHRRTGYIHSQKGLKEPNGNHEHPVSPLWPIPDSQNLLFDEWNGNRSLLLYGHRFNFQASDGNWLPVLCERRYHTLLCGSQFHTSSPFQNRRVPFREYQFLNYKIQKPTYMKYCMSVSIWKPASKNIRYSGSQLV